MQYLAIEHATKTYGEKVLFKDVSFTISQGDRIALIAKNGSGKTTLMRVLSGEEGIEGEGAKLIIDKNIRTSFLHQEPDLNPEAKIIDEVFEADLPAIKAVKAYEVAVLSNDANALQEATLLMDDHKAWDVEARVNIVLAKLKIANLDQKIKTLSGGQRKRVALAKLIIEEPEFIILDEPTNHLDIDMIEWLEEYLQGGNVTLFMVTHDRYFLERVCNEIMELDMGKMHMYRGNYSQYLEKKEARLANEAVVYDKTKKLFKRELEWVRRMPQARTTKSKSRVDSFHDIKESLRDKRNTDEMQILIEPTRLGSKIVELHSVSKAYGDKKLITKFDYKFKKGERVGIVGVNGAGKSTLIKMITGLEPTDTGKIIIGETINFGYFGQDGLVVNETKMVIDVIRDIAEYIPLAKGMKLTAESLLEKFLFPRSQQRVQVSQLSGGERRRLYLLTILIKNPNFLILDEPTNDLDIITLNVLEDYLEDYPGCLIIVSHDRYFLDKLVDHIFVLEGDGAIKDYNGTYTEYRMEKNEEAEINREAKSQSNTVAAPTTSSENKLSFEQQKQIKALEKQIERLEQRKAEVTAKFEDMNLAPDMIGKLSSELATINAEIEEKEMKWMELVEG
ncbi:MAG TPA: ABC-F family ATP-binding cassette domain-containing protein [Saprospiraceae bacterium]|nr:ABC-F family ATP-binding cassette domain-containing protein [Saprospiraceae bacterium]HOY11561.1 ABC-F family ATP-binding cassette domain-containing protein [Saprospiraceae bacterium]HPN68276.1 ABC-F family ATP-binding cassette domain-containing protein [Saprospiraceae bacterium]